MIAVVLELVVAAAAVLVLVPAAMAAAVRARMLALVALAHPLVAHEVHRLAAGGVAAAVAAPVLLVRRRNVQVDRIAADDRARLRDDHRLRQDERRPRHVADVHPAVDAGLVDADRHADLGERGTDGADGEGGGKESLHGVSGERAERRM
jgi:hypothetical protein